MPHVTASTFDTPGYKNRSSDRIWIDKWYLSL